MNDKILEMFFDTERWRYAIEKGVGSTSIRLISISLQNLIPELLCTLLYETADMR